LPTNQNRGCGGRPLRRRSFLCPTFSDNCAGAALLCSPASATRFAVGVTTVTCVATDGSGNTNRCTFTVTVQDREKPVITCPTNIVTATEPGRCDAAVTFRRPLRTIAAWPQPPACRPREHALSKEQTLWSATARDASGNEQTCSFTVTVNDSERPAISCPTDLTLNTATGRCDAVATFSVTATDNCGAVPVTCVPPSGSTFAKGTNAVNCTAGDPSGKFRRVRLSRDRPGSRAAGDHVSGEHSHQQLRRPVRSSSFIFADCLG